IQLVARTLNERASIRSIRPHLRYRRVGFVHGRQEHPPTISILNVCRQDKNSQNQAEHIDEEMPLSPLDLFAGIIAARTTHLRRLHRLAIDDRSSCLRIAPRSHSRLATKRISALLPSSVLLPYTKIVIDRLPGREVVR